MTLTARLAGCRERDMWDHDPTEEEVLGQFVFECLVGLFRGEIADDLPDELASAIVDELSGGDPRTTSALVPKPDRAAREYIARQIRRAQAVAASDATANAKVVELVAIQQLLIARMWFTAANQIAELVRAVRAGGPP